VNGVELHDRASLLLSGTDAPRQRLLRPVGPVLSWKFVEEHEEEKDSKCWVEERKTRSS
jgi:hypothetical protein